MYYNSTHLIVEADCELQNNETTSERVQELFKEWWPRRNGGATFQDDAYALPVKLVDLIGFAGLPAPRYGVLHFPKAKLAESQVELLEKCQDSPENNAKADEFILWAAGRAAAIALAPIPLADVGPLMANEAYMIYRIADVYGFSIDKSVVAMLCGVAGGSILGKIGASFLPFLKVPIAAGITYAVGKTAKAYFASGMSLSRDELTDIFTTFRNEADTIDWRERKVEADDNIRGKDIL